MKLYNFFSPTRCVEFAGLGDPDQREMDERSTSEDDRICFLLKEKDSERHISCKHRLTRSKFNYNPFGLRFGKRDGRLKTDKTGTRKILPLLLFVRELEEASWTHTHTQKKCNSYELDYLELWGWWTFWPVLIKHRFVLYADHHVCSIKLFYSKKSFSNPFIFR